MIYQLPRILAKQNTDFVHFIYCTNIFSFIAWQKKALPCQSTDRVHWSNGVDERSKCKHVTIRQQLTALWSNGKEASSDWKYSSPMMLGIQWGQQSYFRVTVPLFITTLLKCSASTCAYWRPYSWWRNRWPPSSSMPRNGTGYRDHTILINRIIKTNFRHNIKKCALRNKKNLK